jgi:uncharacterized protein (DUF2267 family)
MEYDEFVKKVQGYAGLASPEEAARIAQITLEVFGERISRVHRKHLDTQLPGDLKKVTEAMKSKPVVFSLEDFYNRVGARARLGFHKAMADARAVMRVVFEQVARGEIDDIFAELGEEWKPLKEMGPPGPLSPYTVDTHEMFPGKAKKS